MAGVTAQRAKEDRKRKRQQSNEKFPSSVEVPVEADDEGRFLPPTFERSTTVLSDNVNNTSSTIASAQELQQRQQFTMAQKISDSSSGVVRIIDPISDKILSSNVGIQANQFLQSAEKAYLELVAEYNASCSSDESGFDKNENLVCSKLRDEIRNDIEAWKRAGFRPQVELERIVEVEDR